jgi:DNA-binding MarR family transcriptional regulator
MERRWCAPRLTMLATLCRDTTMGKELRLTAPTLKVIGALMSRPREESSGADIGAATKLSSGTLYPILVRLEAAGWLESRWESEEPSLLGRPRRRYYRVTAEGARNARKAVRDLQPTFGRLAWR